VDGFEFASVDLVQHGPAGHSEGLGGLIEAKPAVGHFGDDPAADVVGDADVPGSLGGELLAMDEAVVDPAIDGGLVHAEDTFGLGDRYHLAIIVGGG
jgi:hypothetical protein